MKVIFLDFVHSYDKGNYILNAEAIEESIIYCISSELLENNITINAKANKYLLASFVSNIRNPYAHENIDFLENQVENIQQSKTHFTELHSVSYSKDSGDVFAKCDHKISGPGDELKKDWFYYYN